MNVIEDVVRPLLEDAAENLTDEQLAELAKNPHPAVRRAIAGNARTPKDTLSVLADDEDVSVLRALAHNKRLNRDLTSRLLKVDDEALREHVLTCSAPNAAFYAVINGDDYEDIHALLHNRDLDERMLTRLFNRALAQDFGVCRDFEVFQHLALHKNTPDELRLKLTFTGGGALDGVLARSPYTPTHLLVEFAFSADPTVSALARLNPSLPQDIQEQLKVDGEFNAEYIRMLNEEAVGYDPDVVEH